MRSRPEFGDGVDVVYSRGSDAHDEIAWMPTESAIVCPIGLADSKGNHQRQNVGCGYPAHSHTKESSPIRGHDYKEPFLAQHERSDTCTVPAAIRNPWSRWYLPAHLEKFGGDSLKKQHGIILDI
jgi:chorismate synthase